MKLLGTAAGGTIGILALGLLLSNILNNGLAWLFGALLVIFVIAGAIALLLRSGGGF